MPKDKEGKQLNIVVRGDHMSKLFNVYIGKDESPGGAINDWKWVR